jgi:hypothetical protein
LKFHIIIKITHYFVKCNPLPDACNRKMTVPVALKISG